MIYIILIVTGFFAAGSFYVSCKERAERKRAETELNEVKENAEKTAEIITEANETKANASSGNHSSDFLYIANKLHDYANK